MARCNICEKNSPGITKALSLCKNCIIKNNENVRNQVNRVHNKEKGSYNAREYKSYNNARCKICALNCEISPGKKGRCGLRENIEGKLINHAGTPKRGVLEYYFDPIPTNCVAFWTCPASKNTFYMGKKNLAVFYGACCLNCLFCQNYQYRYLTSNLRPMISSEELASKIDASTACICFFGGDPAPQLPHAIRTARRAMKSKEDLIICFETSGQINPRMLDKVIELSLATGGTVKFDIKAYNSNIYKALTGQDNARVFDNFARCASISKKEGVTLAVASTLLVPGYIDSDEVYKIASFIASYDPSAPYTLLAYHPQFQMNDLSFTSRKEAEECVKKAKEAGLRNVRLSNQPLLSTP